MKQATDEQLGYATFAHCDMHWADVYQFAYGHKSPEWQQGFLAAYRDWTRRDLHIAHHTLRQSVWLEGFDARPDAQCPFTNEAYRDAWECGHTFALTIPEAPPC